MPASDVLQIVQRRGQRVRHALAKVEGLEWTESDRGKYQAGNVSARVKLEPHDWIRVWLDAGRDIAPREALAANASLAGNVRFAAAAGECLLQADTQINGEAHLAETFRQIRSGFDQANRSPVDDVTRAKQPTGESRLPAAALAELVEQLPWGPEALVQRDDGWEVRVRLSGDVTPLLVASAGSMLRVTRTLIDAVPDGDCGESLAAQALRFNRQLRLARIAERAGCLVVEAQLHQGQLNASWLKQTVLAVAVGSRYVRPALEVLAAEPEVSRAYQVLVAKPR